MGRETWITQVGPLYLQASLRGGDSSLHSGDALLPGLKMEDRAVSQGMLLEAGKGKEMGSPLECPEGTQPFQYLDLFLVQ